MPRKPDPGLESRILNAAQKLWKKGGSEALTMRRVAKVAGTNTPAVYRRFRDREDILRALLLRIRQELLDKIGAAESIEQLAEYYLDFALEHPHEYDLYFRKEYELFHAVGRPLGRPGMEMMKQRLRERLGPAPDHHARLTLALWMVVHGAAMFLITKAVLPEQVPLARSIVQSTVETLLGGASASAGRAGGR